MTRGFAPRSFSSSPMSRLRSRKRLRTRVGPMAATCGSTFVGTAMAPIACKRSRMSWSATRDRIPAAYVGREFPAAGGLMSYGTNQTDASRQVGVYTGNILKGAKPAELPVQQAVKFELVINRGTATLLGIEVPPQLLALATEIIE